MATTNDMITRAMKALKALGGNEVPSAAEYTDGLNAFNMMLESMSLERLATYRIQEQSFTLTIGTASYTIGPGGAINTTRPLDITQAYIQDTNSNNYLLTIVPRDKWNQIGNRGSTITSQIPDTLFYDPQYPLGVINIFPTPLLGYTCFYDSALQQVTSVSGSTTISMPPGYERMYVFNLAVEMANMFGFEIPPVGPGQKNVVELAAEAKANVKRNNLPEIIANYDGAIVSRSYASYNIFRDRG